MTKFNIHDWRHKQVIESYKIRLSDQNTIEFLAEIYMANLSKNKLYENISPQQYNQLKEQVLKKLSIKAELTNIVPVDRSLYKIYIKL